MEGGFQNPTDFDTFILLLEKTKKTKPKQKQNQQKKGRVAGKPYKSILCSWWSTVFVQLRIFPGWSPWRSICISKTIFMALQLWAPTCWTQGAPNAAHLSLICDLCKFDSWIQRVGSSPWPKSHLAMGTQPYCQSKASFYFCWSQSQELRFRFWLLVMKSCIMSLEVLAQIQRLNGRSILA